MRKKLCLALAFVLLLSTIGASAATVKHGSSGDTVRQVQAALKNLGYYNGDVDGVFGDALYTAVWWYQKDNGLAADGVAGTKTQIALGLVGGSGSQSVTGSLAHGAKGVEVFRLQTALKNAGYYNGALDGEYFDSTFTAVWQYQRDHGLLPDGIANSQVLSMLDVNSITTAPAVQLGGTSFKVGSSGDMVKAIQTALNKLGYFTEAVDGVYGDSTFTAVWKFQRDRGLVQDGVAGAKTLEMLGIGYTQSASVLFPEGRVLSFGSSGEYVRILQTGLKNLGYFKGTVDGKFGDSTYQAVWWFQQNNGLVYDGKVNSYTWNVLFGGGAGSSGTVSGTLRYGNAGDAVLALQKRLAALKYLPGKLDGIFGQNTYNAVRDFQQNNKLTVDGVAGTRTLNALNSPYAVTKP